MRPSSQPGRVACSLLGLGLLLAACAAPSARPSPTAVPALDAARPTGAAAPTSPPAPVRLVQALPTRDFGFLPAIVATSKGFMAAEGIQLELPVMPSNVAIPAITNKEVHFAAAGSGVRAAYRGAPLRAIFYYYNQNTLIAVGASEVRSYKDLVGKVLAIASPGSSEDWVIKLLLNREGIPLSDVQLVALGQGPQRVQALLAGQVQFTVLNADLAVDLERRGFTILGDVRSLLPVPWSGFVAHQDALHEQPDVLKRWIRANIRALQFMKQHPEETAAIATQELGLDPDLALRAVELVLPAINDDDPGGFTEAGLLLNTQLDMEALGLSGDPAELGRGVHDVTLLRQVQRELGVRCTGGYQCS